MIKAPRLLYSSERRSIKRMAKNIISDHSVRFKMIMASLICVTSFMLTQVIKDSLYYAISLRITSEYAYAFDLVFVTAFSVLRLLILSPLFIGFFSLSVKLASGKNTDLQDIFIFYSDKKTLFNTWLVGAVVMLPQTVLFFLFFNVPDFCRMLVEKVTRPDLDAWIIVFTIAIEIGILVLSLFSLRLYTVINAYVCGSGQGAWMCICAAVHSTQGNILNSLVFIVSFIPWILLSLCTVGVLFVIFTLPYMIVSYNFYSSHLIKESLTKVSNSEEI